MIEIAHGIAIDEAEIEERFIRSGGPGGQNVNKVASAVQLRFDAARCPSLPDDVKTRLKRIAGSRMTKDGVIVLTARTSRDQSRNRVEARARLVALIAEAAEPERPRRPTRVPNVVHVKRRDAKAKRGAAKRLRTRPSADD